MPFPWDGSSGASSFLICVCVVLMIVSAFRPQSFDTMRSITEDIFSPVLSTISLPFQKVTIFLHDVTGLAQLQADNHRLGQENVRLKEWYQTALLLQSENKSLRSLLNLDVDPKYKHVSARVLVDSGNTYLKSLLVSAGKSDGIDKGSAVLSGDGLIGRIVSASENTARILLVTDINSRVPVVMEDTGQHAIMAGGNNQNPRLIHLPQDSEISSGARVVTSGYGGVYPQGLPVGRVVLDENHNPSVVLFADFYGLQIVRILYEEKLNSNL